MSPELLAERYRELTGAEPEGTWFAPGRVNLIGEHTDYNDGFVLPFALSQRAVVAGGARSDEVVLVHSAQLDQTVQRPLGELAPGQQGWAAYLMGVVWAFREAGHDVGGITLVLTSDVPRGAGLSSSAALECAVAAALCDLYHLEISPLERAQLCQRAENDYVGAPTGLLDQAASTLCREGEGLFLDCRTLETQPVPLPLAERGLEVLVLDTRTPHSLAEGGEYAARRRSCEQAAKILGLAALRDVTDLDRALEQLDDEVLRRRVRHVVTENQRTVQARDLATAGAFEELGPLLDQSHASMRDDYEITVPTVDLAVEVARRAGALGARMTGGGFGGCIIALCRAGEADRIGTEVAAAFRAAGHDEPAWFSATPAPGAGRLT